MNEINLVSLKIVREKKIKYQLNQELNNPRIVYEIAKKLKVSTADRETMLVFYLDTKLQITNVQIIAIGVVDVVGTTPREVFKTAFLTNSCYIMFAHNHPSGVLKFSTPDIEFTKRMIEAGKVVCVEVLDHIIFSDIAYRSMKEEGVIL